jgi:hypothetical protein
VQWAKLTPHANAVLSQPISLGTVVEAVVRPRGTRFQCALLEWTAAYIERPDAGWTPITDIAPNEVQLARVSARRTPHL